MTCSLTGMLHGGAPRRRKPTTSTRLVWRRFEHPALDAAACARVEARVDAELESWVGTPFVAGQRLKGVGVDCVRFVAAVLDEMFRETRIPLDRLPQDLSMHNPAGARAALRLFKKAYAPTVDIADNVVEVGDVIIVGVRGPAHAIFCGSKQSYLYEAGSRRVIRTGLSTLRHPVRVFATIRPVEKHRWA